VECRLGHVSKHFNVGSFRRQLKDESHGDDQDASFFDHNNAVRAPHYELSKSAQAAAALSSVPLLSSTHVPIASAAVACSGCFAKHARGDCVVQEGMKTRQMALDMALNALMDWLGDCALQRQEVALYISIGCKLTAGICYACLLTARRAAFTASAQHLHRTTCAARSNRAGTAAVKPNRSV
jgi:hypothetical protein